MKGNIFFIERNVRGAWVVYGALGVRQYYGYSKKEARDMYNEECKVIFEVKRNDEEERKKREKP